MKISVSENIKTSAVKTEDLENIICMITTDPFLKAKIDNLRKLSTAEEKRQYKVENLPYFCPGLFEDNLRRKDHLQSIGMLILDLDHLTQEELERIEQAMKKDCEIFFFFVSPSGSGLKVAILFDREITDPGEYDKAFRAYVALFAAKYNIEVDLHGSDCSRACFLSHDPDLYLNNDHRKISVDEWLNLYEQMNQKEEKGTATTATKQSSKLSEAVNFLIYGNNETGAIYNNYRGWQVIGLALASIGEEGRQYFLELSLANAKYSDSEESLNKEYDKLLKYYGANDKRPVSIGTLFYFARQHGFNHNDDGPGDDPSSPSAALSGQSAEETEKDYWDILAEIHALNSEAAKEKAIKALAGKMDVKEKSIKADLKTLASTSANITAAEKVIIAHPAYTVRPDLLVLGFRETVVVGDKPEDRNFFIIAEGNGRFRKISEPIFQFGDFKVVLDMRDRDLVRFEDRWSREGLKNFLASPEPPVDLYNRIKDTLKKFMECQKEEHYGLIAAWIIASYFNRCFNGFPYIFFYGKKQTAKSRGLVIIELLAFNAVKVRGSSIPSFIDTIDGNRGVFLTDQAEFLSDKKNSELISYHTDSYTTSGGKKRLLSITNGIRKVLEFEAYSPKGYAAQRDIDKDLRDRCITITMIRAKKEYDYPAAHLPIWGEMRHDLYRLLLTKWQEVMVIYENAGIDMSLRIRELWRPLITILTLEKVPDAEINQIKKVFKEIMLVNQDELSEKEYFLVDTLLSITEFQKGNAKGLILSPLDIAKKMNSNPQTVVDLGFLNVKSLSTWVGKVIGKLVLSSGRYNNPKVRQHQYIFHYSHVKEIKERFEINIDTNSNDKTSVSTVNKETEEQ